LERALKHFTDALAIVENMPEVDEDKKREKVNLKIMVLESIKSVYKNMNNELKFMEIKKRVDIAEEELTYITVLKNGTQADAAVRAGLIAEMYLNLKDDYNYKIWIDKRESHLK
jgi:hypothetical protein